jgi:hypothetical protein
MIRFSLLKNVQVMRILLSGVSGFRRLLLPLVAALCIGNSGCTSVTSSGADLVGLGFASDTTAILFYELWEKTESFSIPTGNYGTNYPGWELKLVDIRFNKVYWKARVDHGKRNTQILRGQQWNDSTMLVELTGGGYWLWTIGNKKPQRADFKWNVEVENHRGGLNLSGLAMLRPWKNDSILVLYNNNNLIIDTKTMTVNDWYPIGENAWVTSCHNFWWGRGGGVCWVNNEQNDKSYDFTLLSEEGDSLGNFIYTWEIVDYYSSGWFPDRRPAYWIFGKRDFLDSL